MVVGEVSTRDWCRRSARQRTLDSESALVVGGVMSQKRKKRQSDTARSQKQSALVVGAKMGAQPRKATPLVMATFTENLAARIKKAKTANKKNTQRSKPATGNHDNKKHRLRGLCFTCV